MSLVCLIGLIFLAAGFIQGMTGFGSALVAMPLLCLLIDIKEAVPLCILNSLIITTFLTVQLRKNVDPAKILPLCLSAFPGIAVGTTVLKQLSGQTISLLLGILLILYSLYNLFVSPRPRKLHVLWGYIAGFSSGAIGAAFSAGGPPTIIYTTLNNWAKDDIKATMTGFFAFNSVVIAIVHTMTGLTTTTVFKYFGLSAPFVLGGTIAGSLCYGLLSQRVYLKIIFCFLLLMGILMLPR